MINISYTDKMAINFASFLFKPAIFCDKVSRDGYSIQNLISSNSSERNKGYMTESFIKVPVTIVIKFCCNIEISHLILNTAVGSQITSGLEVYTKSDEIKMVSLENNPPELNSEVTAGMFTRMGKAIDLNASVFCFKNKMFKAFESFLHPNFDGVLEGTVCRDLRRHNAKAINYVSHVMIRLILTQGGKVPALKSLEVWGQPSLSCPRPTITSVLELFQSNYAAYLEDTEDEEVFEEKSSTIITPDEDTIEGIPTDFIDPITCSLMVMPILLPSGHTIDQLTLDKYIDTEANWGRGPSDPFTGVIFTKNSKPIPNVGLKILLDKYLLNCGNDPKFKELARSLGRKSDSHHLKSSILVSQENQEIKKNKKETETNKESENKKETERDKKETERDRKDTGRNKDTERNKKEAERNKKEAEKNKKETERTKKETERTKKETQRNKKETQRDKKETGRDKKETERDKKETERDKKETERDKKEIERDKKEIERDKKEIERDKKETEKDKKETEKDKKEMELNKKINKKVMEINKKTNKKEMEISNKDIQEDHKSSKKKCSGTKRDSASTKSEKVSSKRIKVELFSEDEKTVDKTNSVDDLDLSDNSLVKSEPKPISCTKSNQPKCHANILKESLDCALLNTLRNLPSFSTKTSVWQTKLKNHGINVNMSCVCCKTETLALFRLPCSHNLCRTCLLSKNNSRSCDKCQQFFKSSDPVRMHL